jgi:hypothetical protein
MRSWNQLICEHNFEYIFWSVGGMELIGLRHPQLNLGFAGSRVVRSRVKA